MPCSPRSPRPNGVVFIYGIKWFSRMCCLRIVLPGNSCLKQVMYVFIWFLVCGVHVCVLLVVWWSSSRHLASDQEVPGSSPGYARSTLSSWERLFT